MCRGKLACVQNGKFSGFCKKWNIFLSGKQLKIKKRLRSEGVKVGTEHL